MRHVDKVSAFAGALGDAEGQQLVARLGQAQVQASSRQPEECLKYIIKNGPKKWSPVKKRVVQRLGKKCWYTEAIVTGGDVVVDHYRPKSEYTWLAFVVDNYRVASPVANSVRFNEAIGARGGKGDAFPLLAPSKKATCQAEVRLERPVLLDPCERADCDLVTFQADGRPMLNPLHAQNATAKYRVAESSILLNLDHPDFNSARERLQRDIAGKVAAIEELQATSSVRQKFLKDLHETIQPSAAFSSAARAYLSLHRYLDWVEALLRATPP